MNDEDRKAFEEWITPRTISTGVCVSPAEIWQAALEYARKWRPISEAPKDGTHILAQLEDSATCYVITWVDSKAGIRSELGKKKLGWCIAWDGYLLNSLWAFQPTHFQYLPEPPA